MTGMHTTPESSGVLTVDAKTRTTGWRRYLRFPKTWREVRALGWRFVLAFVLFYLIRDTILYIIIPYLVYKGIIGH